MHTPLLSTGIKLVSIYVRVSTDDQDCERQVRDLTAYAERRGWTVVSVYRETASGARNDRKERAKIIECARQGAIHAILVTELTRWGRSTVDLIHTVQKLASYSVALLTHTGEEFNPSTAHGQLMLTLLAAFSEFERNILAERTKSGLATARAKGKKLGRPTGNRTVKAHKEAVIRLHEAGISNNQIAKKLSISTHTVNRCLKSS